MVPIVAKSFISFTENRASDLIRLLHGALGAGAGGPVTAYLGQQNQAEQSMVTIGGLMQKVSCSIFSPEDATYCSASLFAQSLEQFENVTFRRWRLQLPNPVVPLFFFVEPSVGFAHVSVGLVYVGGFG